jgi:CheY-like chemotaxis protein
VLSKPLQIEVLDQILASICAGERVERENTHALPALADSTRDAETVESMETKADKLTFLPKPGMNYVSRVGLTEVLIVEDSAPNYKMLGMLFSRKGLKSIVAENGQLALDKVLRDLEKYKLIIMDNLMPVMNGRDATAVLRQAGFKYLIIGLTGNVLEDDKYDFLSAGADMVLFKPLDVVLMEKLLLTIERRGPLSSPNEYYVEVTGKATLSVCVKPQWPPATKGSIVDGPA